MGKECIIHKIMYKNRKGQIGKVAEIILILAGSMILYMFIASVIEGSTFNQVINTCRFSVQAQSATELSPGITGAKSPFRINCEKRYIDFYNTRVELGLSPTNMKPRPINVEGKQMNKFKELTDFTVNQVIAEEMRICKYQFLDGKEDVFANDDYLLKSKDVCFVCTEIKFNDVRKESFDTFLEYTQKVSFDDTRVTYFDYLTEKTIFDTPMWIQPYFGEDEPYGDLTIDTSKDYVVIIKKYSRGKWMDVPKTLNGPLTFIQNIKESFTAKENLAPLSVAIVPSKDINDYCDVQAS